MDTHPSDVKTTSTRRRVLKRAAAGGAAVWAVPAIFGSSTAVAASPGKECVKTADETSSGFPCKTCAACDHTCNGGAGCCFVDVKGCCFCGVSGTCDPALVCRRNSDCPPGSRCAYTCCGELECVTISSPARPGHAVAGGGQGRR